MSGRWSLAAPTDPESTEIRMWAESGGCLQFDQAVAAESPESVLVAVRLIDTSTPGVVCTASLLYQPVTVTLVRPLGERVVQHATPDDY